MEDDASNDVELVEYIDSQDEDDADGDEKRPIMLLLRRLIRNKQNTVMTNAQIINILESEFNICVKTSHELEVDIYIKIIKKYLKDWPQWEELERISTKLSNIKDFEAVTIVLNHKYKNLKEYLGVMLEAAKPLAQEAVKSLTPETAKIDDNIDSSDVVMEIQCTKEQLNNLFFRRPRLDLNNTVFNMSNVTPSRISLKRLTFNQILSGWCLKICVTLLNFMVTREIKHNLKHVLVNKVRNESSSDTVLETSLQALLREQQSKKGKIYSKDMILKHFTDLLSECASQNYEMFVAVQPVIDVFISELKDSFDNEFSYRVPANYKKYANKYKYVRYLYTENDQSLDSRYDLQLEETTAPLYFYYIVKMNKVDSPIPPITEWIKIECLFCKIKLQFTATTMKEVVEAHFNEVHQNEVDWQCTHCKKIFSIDFLCNHKWSHEC